MKSRQHIINFVLTVVICTIICSPVYYFRITQPVDSDFGGHVNYAQHFLDKGFFEPSPAAHPILQLLIIFISKINGGLFELYGSMLIVQILAQGFLAGIVYIWLGDGDKKGWEIWRIGASISVTFIAPVMLLAIKDGLFYFGYIAMANYSNPTVNLLKPIALLCIMQATDVLENGKESFTDILKSASLVIIASFIKPNFTLALLPAVLVISVYYLIIRKSISHKQILLGFILPSVLSLVTQWGIMYASKAPSNRILFAPFFLESAYSDYLLPKFLLSIPFIAQGVYVFRKHLPHDFSLLLGFLVFIFGVFQNYMFVEGGNDLLHGNFRWSGQIVTILFSIIILRKTLKEMVLGKKMYSVFAKFIALVTYVSQLLGGAAYYYYCLTSMHYR